MDVATHSDSTTQVALSPLRPREAAFMAEQRERVTILFGGLTWKHEQLIAAVLRGSGYHCEHLPETDRAAHDVGQEFCASGLCNPVYFTVGNLIRFLQRKQRSGLSAAEIVEQFVYFTAACGGPCRFGMYEAEFRSALRAAGFDRFRVLSFSQDEGIRASTGHTGLQFSVDFGMNTMHAFILGDLMNSMQHSLRTYEVQPGSADRAIAACVKRIAADFSTHRGVEIGARIPRFLCPGRRSLWYRIPNTSAKVWSHLYGNAIRSAVENSAFELRNVEIDRLRIKPVVKVIGEFWAQMTESDGNFRMLEFLEKEGAEVAIEPISTWVLYMLQQKSAAAAYREKMLAYTRPWTKPKEALQARLSARGKRYAMEIGSRIYRSHFLRLARQLGMAAQVLPVQKELSTVAAPYYHPLLRGGEGHLEVAKTLYYTRNRACHLVLALKPFGCLPSIQSDAVQASLVERFPEVSFLSIETSAEGEIHAYSRVQMALAEACAKAMSEFDAALRIARHSLQEIRAFIAERPALRHALEPVPRSHGFISTAANFALHVDHLISAEERKPFGARIALSQRVPHPDATDFVHQETDHE